MGNMIPFLPHQRLWTLELVNSAGFPGAADTAEVPRIYNWPGWRQPQVIGGALKDAESPKAAKETPPWWLRERDENA